MNVTTVQQRDTRQRRIVYETVMERCDHPSADDIYLAIHEKDPRISKGTVYRNLNLLSSSGEILHVRAPGSDRFDSRLDYHCHIICMECGRVEDAPVRYNPEFDMDVSKRTGFCISRHRTIFEGTCPVCMEKKAPEENE